MADRFHLWANLGQAVEKTVIAHRGCLAESDLDLDAGLTDDMASDVASPRVDVDANVDAAPLRDGFLDACGRPRRLVQRDAERFEAVQKLRAQGMSIRAISHRLQLDRKTVRRFADTASLDELVFKATHRISKLDVFKPYLDHRVGQGCTNAVVLFAELKKLGFARSDQTVRRYLAPLRPKGVPSATTRTKRPTGRPAPPKPRRVASWIMTNPAHLKPGNALQLKRILARCPELEALARHVTGFAAMMGKLRGDQLGEWMSAVAADDLHALHSMVYGMRRDLDAVTAGLTLPWSSGVVEGHVNRILCLNARCSGGPTSTCCASESCSPPDPTKARRHEHGDGL